MEVFKFYSGVNYAENARDKDNIVLEDIAYFSTLEKAENFIIDYLRKNLNWVVDNCNFTEEYKKEYKNKTEEILPKKIILDNKNKWYFYENGSWAKTYCLEKIEVF